MHKHSYKEQEKQRREKEILHKAEQLLIKHGYANLNMDTLADEVGVSKPTLYQHFKSKEDLVSHVMMHSFDSMEERFGQPVQGTPLDQLKHFFSHMIKTRLAQTNVFAIADADLLWTAIRHNPILAEHRARAMEKMCSVVEQAQAQGQITATIPSGVVMRMLFALSNFSKDSTMKWPQFDAGDQDRAIEAIWQVILHGIAPEETHPVGSVTPSTDSKS